MRHVRLATGMAKATQTDLVTAHQSGDLSQQDWADMVQCCRACEWADRCDDWSLDHPRARCAPNTCPNRARFAALQQTSPTDDSG